MILAIAAAFVVGSIATGTIAFADDDDDELSQLACEAGKVMTGILFEDDITDILCATGNVNDADSDPSNEDQTLSTTGGDVVLGTTAAGDGGGTVTCADITGGADLCDGVDDVGNPVYLMVQLTTDGTPSSFSLPFGLGSAEIVTSNGISWNSATNKVTISQTGVYEIVLSAHIEKTTLNPNPVGVKIDKNGVTINSVGFRLLASTDPHHVGVSWLGTLSTGDTIQITRFSGGPVTFESGSTLIIKRIA